MGQSNDWTWIKELIALVNEQEISDAEKWKTVRMAVCDTFHDLTPFQALIRSLPRKGVTRA